MAVEGFRPERLTRRRALLGAAFTCLAPVVHAADAPLLLFDQLYKSFGVRGYEFSGVALALNGKQVAMRGYMAPPLKPESRFFDLKSATPLVSAGEPVLVSGRLEVGSWTDPDTEFVSQIRIVDATFWRD